MPTPSDAAFARAFLWRFVAAAFGDLDAPSWQWLRLDATHAALRQAAAASPQLTGPADAALNQLRAARSLGDIQDAFLGVFGHTVRGECPPHEIEYGELRADALFQPHRLADIAAFYRAFGLEVADDAAERVDHIAMECEFYAVLCAKEAHAQESPDHLAICRDAQKKFLREHLARWTPAFSRRLARLTNDPLLQALADFLNACVTAECAHFGVPAGNDDLQLRPAEEPMDPCGSCGLANATAGAAPQEA
ncbi:MAG: molecular chaperone TorD family protein [Verrucomicrobia bacterium]|nr:molecular chaperone TorD family protein [Verrucomicrobiota bacterium]